eukprot:scaffold318_cov17-Prasinocladus_malaysianus.AAC.1
MQVSSAAIGIRPPMHMPQDSCCILSLFLLSVQIQSGRHSSLELLLLLFILIGCHPVILSPPPSIVVIILSDFVYASSLSATSAARHPTTALSATCGYACGH